MVAENGCFTVCRLRQSQAHHCLLQVIGLLVFLLTCCVVLAVISVTVIFPYPFSTEDGGKSDFHSVLFMLTECVIISVKTIHVLIR